MKEFNYERFTNPAPTRTRTLFLRLLKLIVDYLQGMLDAYQLDVNAIATNATCWRSVFHHLVEMQPMYLKQDGNVDSSCSITWLE